MISKTIEKLLSKVQKPGRYVGGELNSVIKSKEDVEIRFAFCFPDIYEVGMSHLGMKILYSQLNTVPYIWCERVFAPWADMEEQMRRCQVPLYALESGDSLADFDIIGFTLQYELSYTNILNMLDLAGVPLKACDRHSLSRLVVAGGPCACNPEPLADISTCFLLEKGKRSTLKSLHFTGNSRKKAGPSRIFCRPPRRFRVSMCRPFTRLNIGKTEPYGRCAPNAARRKP